MNGIEVTRQIRRMGDDTPIIILTAYDWSNIEEEAKEAGVTAFCAKPMFMSDLRDTLMTDIGQLQAVDADLILHSNDTIDFEGKRLLLVEDNDLNRELVVEILSECGFYVDTAENGVETIEKLSLSRPGDYDLVLMNIQMPVMDGYEATRRIRLLDDPELSSLPIIVMTANTFDEDRRAALECGMNGFILKPLDMKELIHVLKSVLERRQRKNLPCHSCLFSRDAWGGRQQSTSLFLTTPMEAQCDGRSSEDDYWKLGQIRRVRIMRNKTKERER